MWRARATKPRACVAEEAARPVFSHDMARGPAFLRRTPHSWLVKRVFLTRTGKSSSLENALEHQPACKPGFVGRRPLAQTTRDGHSSGTMFAHCLKQPTRTASLTWPCGVFAHRANEPALPSLFGLAPGVVCHAVSVAGPAVRSYRTFSPLLPPPFWGRGSGSFSVALSLGLPPPDVIRHRMSMEPGLSSPATFR
jgi:hypothetical protein